MPNPNLSSETESLLRELLVFARTKEPKERYDYSDAYKCALSQFFRHKYGKPTKVYPECYCVEGEEAKDLPKELDYVSWAPNDYFPRPYPIDEYFHWTWGYLANRVTLVLAGDVNLVNAGPNNFCTR